MKSFNLSAMKRKRSSAESEYSDDEDVSLLEVKRRRNDVWTNYLVDEATGSAVCVLCLKSYKLDRLGGMCAGMVHHYERGCETPTPIVNECSVVLQRLSPALLQKYALPDFDMTPGSSLSDDENCDFEVLSEGMRTPSFSEGSEEDDESAEEMTERLLAKYDVVVDESPPPTPLPSSEDPVSSAGDPATTELDEISQALDKMYDLNKRPKRKVSLDSIKPVVTANGKTAPAKQLPAKTAAKTIKKEKIKVVDPGDEILGEQEDKTEHFTLRGYVDVSWSRPPKKREVWSKFLVNEKLKSAVCKKCFRKYKLNGMNKRGGLVVGMVNHVENNCVRQTPGSKRFASPAMQTPGTKNRFASPAMTAAKSKAEPADLPDDLGDLEWSVIKELFPDDVPDNVDLNGTLNDTLLNGTFNVDSADSLANKKNLQYFLERGYIDVSLGMSDRRKEEIWSMFLVNKDAKQAACKYCFAVYKMAKYTNMGIGAGMSKHADKGCGIKKGRKSKVGEEDLTDLTDIEMKVYQEMIDQEAKMFAEQEQPPPRSPSPEAVLEEEVPEEDFSEEHKAKIQTYISKGFEDGSTLIGSMHKNLSTWRNYLAHRTTKVAICKRCFKVFTLDPRSQLGLKSSMTKHAETRCGTLKPGQTPFKVEASSPRPTVPRLLAVKTTPSIRRSLPSFHSSLRIKLLAQKAGAKLRSLQKQQEAAPESSIVVPLERQTTEDLVTCEMMLEELLKAEWLPPHRRLHDPVKKAETVLPLDKVLDMPAASEFDLCDDLDDTWDLDTYLFSDSEDLVLPPVHQMSDSEESVGECPGATYSPLRWRGQLTCQERMLVEALSAEINEDIPNDCH